MDILIITIIVAIAIVALIVNSVVITNQKTLKHIVLFGKYWRTARPALSFRIPVLSWV
jgi:regulator of protease activity HflC (stomatin/prohibitin superfamily)